LDIAFTLWGAAMIIIGWVVTRGSVRRYNDPGDTSRQVFGRTLASGIAL
jgi:hypothetical protein